MQTNNLQRATQRKESRQVGRGGRRGKTSGRGTKGQKARAGHKIRPEARDVIKRLPKLRGRGKNSNKTIQDFVYVFNLDFLEKQFAAGAKVSPATLTERGMLGGVSTVTPRVKILGDGTLNKKLSIEKCAVSASARAKIEKVGGVITQ